MTAYVCIELSTIAIYSCYSSGNEHIHDLTRKLDEIGQIRQRRGGAVIAGDFNAKSHWGMNFTDPRGQVITEWLAAGCNRMAGRWQTKVKVLHFKGEIRRQLWI
ncbi:Endonuclease-reverse transcriptase [Popillia japonica]|uniref:Endonuclease-reverse transcriptase n=1 Tax=Popillia japonica TaxID=7064 RepID=A0AAW1JG27_POPJA